MNNSKIILEFLGKHYQSGEWIYPNVVKAKTHSSMKNVCETLEKCCEAGTVKKYFNIYCPVCCRFTNDIYETVDSVPDETCCPHCDNEIRNSDKKAITVYKMI